MSEAIKHITEQYNTLSGGSLAKFSEKAFGQFAKLGLPAVKHEEWRYTRVAGLFRDDLTYPIGDTHVKADDLKPYLLPEHDGATSLVFVNGIFTPALSGVKHGADELTVLPLSEAASSGAHAPVVAASLGQSAPYHPDGIHALNAAFAGNGLFIRVAAGKQSERPIYIYHISDSRKGFSFSQPRTLVHIGEGASIHIAAAYVTLGHESFTNEVTEIAAEKDATVNYYKIQDEGAKAHHVGTTSIRQLGKCLTNAVTISLSGGLVRNNLDMIMEADHGESHMYGLYLLDGHTHVDNHTIVDNVKPNCFSNELYKGIMDGHSTGVFNGKIFVRKDAQKTNAYQSNKNILLSDHASVNTKPQLEIFADDVKCSHGCTVGRPDDEALFYLRSRGISEKSARSLLLHAFAVDVLDHIKPAALRAHVDGLISERLEFNF
jgi:Fe-S cluster assembly protein SufD